MKLNNLSQADIGNIISRLERFSGSPKSMISLVIPGSLLRLGVKHVGDHLMKMANEIGTIGKVPVQTRKSREYACRIVREMAGRSSQFPNDGTVLIFVGLADGGVKKVSDSFVIPPEMMVDDPVTKHVMEFDNRFRTDELRRLQERLRGKMKVMRREQAMSLYSEIRQVFARGDTSPVETGLEEVLYALNLGSVRSVVIDPQTARRLTCPNCLFAFPIEGRKSDTPGKCLNCGGSELHAALEVFRSRGTAVFVLEGGEEEEHLRVEMLGCAALLHFVVQV